MEARARQAEKAFAAAAPSIAQVRAWAKASEQSASGTTSSAENMGNCNSSLPRSSVTRGTPPGPPPSGKKGSGRGSGKGSGKAPALSAVAVKGKPPGPAPSGKKGSGRGSGK